VGDERGFWTEYDWGGCVSLREGQTVFVVGSTWESVNKGNGEEYPLGSWMDTTGLATMLGGDTAENLGAAIDCFFW
jgi:hypothetical protein